MSARVKHSPGERGPKCGARPFRFPRDFALTADEPVTCPLCRVCDARDRAAEEEQ